jgi:hypothetical protein
VPGRLFERPRLFEQMRGAGDDHEFLRADEPGMGLLVEFDHDVIVSADNQQHRAAHLSERLRAGQVRTAAARHHGVRLACRFRRGL